MHDDPRPGVTEKADKCSVSECILKTFRVFFFHCMGAALIGEKLCMSRASFLVEIECFQENAYSLTAN